MIKVDEARSESTLSSSAGVSDITSKKPLLHLPLGENLALFVIVLL
jgi:hypothetical protein